jgi:hypothetical protein
VPLTSKGEEILSSMEKTYGSEEKAKEVLYASKNAGKITGIDAQGDTPDPARLRNIKLADVEGAMWALADEMRAFVGK